jgi:GWxTD domain-containing protein
MEKGVIKMTIPLKLRQNENYVILVSVQNPIDKQNYLNFNTVFKTKYAAENYKILDANDQIIWTNWIKSGQEIKIQYRYQDSSKIVLSYFKPQFSPALPPFSERVNKDFLIEQPFEQFQLQLTNGKTASIELPHDGLFKIHSGKTDYSGKTILKIFEDFPSVVSPSQKVFGLRYLTPQKEFALMLKDDPSYTVNEFWFFEERSKERSEEMMQTWYARMLRANRLFTNYKEGWKTDRGMIFMVYGPPDQVYYELDKEIWEYGPDASYNDLKFVFHKMASRFIQNEMVLERSPDYKISWYRLLDHWRNEE